ncbi:NPC intracellular cholesterol transporter 2 homolog a [Tetranychus urticae]|uniref:NPC intracellular cholesterol transporter 2 homolog a n=1 Tax=Tetranychus urticae TaxID=32264 RepID=UPI00077B8C65|nr:NPC intracellular cholesterol transporter 2 homolog a [Tetranychus urticae]
MNQFLLIVALINFQYHLYDCIKLKFSSCDLQGGKTHELRIDGCKDNVDPCVLVRGKTAHIEVDFVAPFDSNYVYADVSRQSSTLPISLPLPFLDRDACNNHGLNCPLKKGQNYTYIYDFYVDPLLPSVKGVYHFTLTTFWGYSIGCISVPLEVSGGFSIFGLAID